MTLTTAQDLLDRLPSSPRGGAAVASKPGSAMTGLAVDLWESLGGAAPSTSGETLDKTSPGAITIPTADTGEGLYLAGLRAVAGGATFGLMLYDRLAQFGGFVSNITTAQTVGTPALPSRGDSGNRVIAALLTRTSGGANASVATISYTNQDGTSGRTGTTVSQQWNNTSLLTPFSLQAGDRGVRSVESLTFGTASASAGNHAIVLLRIYGVIGELEQTRLRKDWTTMLRALPSDAALGFSIIGGGLSESVIVSADLITA